MGGGGGREVVSEPAFSEAGGGGREVAAGAGLGFFNADFVGEAVWCGAFSTFDISLFGVSGGLFFGIDTVNTVVLCFFELFGLEERVLVGDGGDCGGTTAGEDIGGGGSDPSTGRGPGGGGGGGGGGNDPSTGRGPGGGGGG